MDPYFTGEVVHQVEPHPGYCPAFTRARDRLPAGELQLLGIGAEERAEVSRLLHNEEQRAREKNPFERIMGFEQNGKNWKLETKEFWTLGLIFGALYLGVLLLIGVPYLRIYLG